MSLAGFNTRIFENLIGREVPIDTCYTMEVCIAHLKTDSLEYNH
jgi:hypothetical protein